MHTANTTGTPQATKAQPATRRGAPRRRRGTPRRRVTLYDGDTPIGTVECRENEPAVGTDAPDVYLRRART